MSNKSIKSQDGKLEVKYYEVTHVCICLSIYALLQYVLLMQEDVVKNHTCYFMSEHIRESVSDKLPTIRLDQGSGITKRFYKITRNFFSRIKYPFINQAAIYAQDHGFLIAIIGKNHYSLLSDGPRFLTYTHSIDTYIKKDKMRHTLRGFLESILYGEITLYPMARGKQCDKIFLTEEEDAKVCYNKPVQVDSLVQLWNASTSSKKQFILSLFDIADSDVSLLKSRPIMFMSQPIIEDYGLSESEYVSLLSAIFTRYDQRKLIVKTHPRDTFQFKKYFPDVIVFEKPINIQLLVLCDICPRKAITICSSSVEAFPDNTEIDWYGVDCHPKIQAHYIVPVEPNRQYHKITL